MSSNFIQELRYFWISWGENHIEVGCGPRYGYGRFLEWRVPAHKQFKVTSLAVTTDSTSHGQFEFAELLGVTLLFLVLFIFQTNCIK